VLLLCQWAMVGQASLSRAPPNLASTARVTHGGMPELGSRTVWWCESRCCGPSNTLACSISQGCCWLPVEDHACCLASESCIAVNGRSLVIPLSFEIQPSPFDSAAPTFFAGLHRGSPLPFPVQRQS